MLTATFAGVSSALVTDGRSAILIDGFFSRPSMMRTVLGRVEPDSVRIDAALARLGVRHLDAVLVSHSHLDHALDAPVVAHRTGAVLAGSASTRNIQVGYGLADAPFTELTARESVRFGSFTVLPIPGLHSSPDAAPGRIDRPLRLPARTGDFKTGECYSFHITHEQGAVTIHGTANWVDGSLRAAPAELLYLGVGAVGTKSAEWREQYWEQTVRSTGARTVRLTHWDAFWRPLDRALRPLPRALDRFDVTVADYRARAAGDGIDLAVPRLWDREIVGT